MKRCALRLLQTGQPKELMARALLTDCGAEPNNYYCYEPFFIRSTLALGALNQFAVDVWIPSGPTSNSHHQSLNDNQRFRWKARSHHFQSYRGPKGHCPKVR